MSGLVHAEFPETLLTVVEGDVVLGFIDEEGRRSGLRLPVDHARRLADAILSCARIAELGWSAGASGTSPARATWPAPSTPASSAS